jgi:hypothetical protein
MASEPGSPDHPNEDFVGATANGVALLDGAGAAGLETGCIHGVAWYAHQLGGQLIARLDRIDLDLRTILGEAIEELAAHHRQTCDLDHPGTPSASVVLLRERHDDFDYLVLADSVLVLVPTDGSEEVISDNREAQVGSTFRAEMDADTGSTNHDNAVQRYVATLRAHRNRPDGFWVAAADPIAAEQAIIGRTASLRLAVLLTDGASRLVDRFGLATWSQAVGMVAGRGPSELIKRVRSAEASDPLRKRWRRAKAHDDATVAVCEPGKFAHLH